MKTKKTKKTKTGRAPSIEGTYRLVSRKLPDGTVQRPPDIVGLLTFTKKYRNFNIMGKDAEGRILSLSYIAAYRLTKTKYSEKSMYPMMNDQVNNKGISYDLTGQSGSSPVTVKDGRIRFKLPLFDEPTLVFEGDKFTAQPPGFINHVDTWKKVE